MLFFVKFLRDKRTPASHRVHQPQVSLCLSRVCAVAQYAVLEANANVNGRGPFSHHHPSETPQPISMSCQIYYYVPQGINVHNLVGIVTAVTDLRMREKTRFVWIFY